MTCKWLPVNFLLGYWTNLLNCQMERGSPTTSLCISLPKSVMVPLLWTWVMWNQPTYKYCQPCSCVKVTERIGRLSDLALVWIQVPWDNGWPVKNADDRNGNLVHAYTYLASQYSSVQSNPYVLYHLSDWSHQYFCFATVHHGETYRCCYTSYFTLSWMHFMPEGLIREVFFF